MYAKLKNFFVNFLTLCISTLVFKGLRPFYDYLKFSRISAKFWLVCQFIHRLLEVFVNLLNFEIIYMAILILCDA